MAPTARSGAFESAVTRAARSVEHRVSTEHWIPASRLGLSRKRRDRYSCASDLGERRIVTQPTEELLTQKLETLRRGLYMIALRRLGDPEAAQDVVQESLVRALAALREGRGPEPEKLGAFVTAIAGHVIADLYRSRERQATFEAKRDRDALEQPLDPLSSLIVAEECDAVRAAMARLSRADQLLLRLCYTERLTPREIGERLGEPAGRIRVRKSRALARLRAAFRQVSRNETAPSTTPLRDILDVKDPGRTE